MALAETARRISMTAGRPVAAAIAAARPPLVRLILSPRAQRVALAGPGVVATTMLVVLGMSLWLPQGPAGIDQIAFPLVLLPLVWAVLFFHACLDRSLGRAAVLALTLCVLNGGAIAWHFAALRNHPTTEASP